MYCYLEFKLSNFKNPKLTNIKHHNTSSVLVWKKDVICINDYCLWEHWEFSIFRTFLAKKFRKTFVCIYKFTLIALLAHLSFLRRDCFPPIFSELVSNWFCQYFGSFPLLLKFHGLWKFKNVSIIWIYYLNFASKSYEWVIVSYPFVLFIQWGIEWLTFIHKSEYWESRRDQTRSHLTCPVGQDYILVGHDIFFTISLFSLFFPSNINNGVLWMIIENVYSYR